MSSSDTTGQAVAGRYRLDAVIGRGGFGLVWRAQDTLLGRVVAVKQVQIPGQLDDADRERLKRKVLHEARTAARLSHIGAVTVFDVVEDEGIPYIVMELVDAPPLSDLVADRGPLSPERTAELGMQILDVLEAAHAQGIIHRDIKPGNVLVPAFGPAKVADFGIASIVDEPSITNSGLVPGSPSYMSPEQAKGHKVGPPTDLWSLGATLYYAVEGQAPFDKGGAIATMVAVCDDPPRPMERAGPLAPVLNRLFTREPAERATAPEAMEALRRTLQPPEPEPAPPRTYRSGGDTEVLPALDWDGGLTTEYAPEPAVAEPEAAPPWSPAEEAPAEQPDAPAPPVLPDPAPMAAEADTEPAPTEPPAPPAPPPQPEPTPDPAPQSWSDLEYTRGEPDTPAPTPRRPPPAEPARIQFPRPAPEPAPSPAPKPSPVRRAVQISSAAPPERSERPERPLERRAPARGGPSLPNRQARRFPVGPAVLAALLVVAIIVIVVALTRGGGTPASSLSPSTGSPAASPGSPAAAAAAVPAGWVSYQDPATGFAIAHPPGWQVAPNGSRTDFKDPASGAYLRVDHIQPPGPSAVGAWQDQEKSFAPSHAGYQRLQLAPTTFDGFSAATWEFLYTEGGAQLHALDLGFITARYGFALYFQTKVSDWARLQPSFEAFKASFQAPA